MVIIPLPYTTRPHIQSTSIHLNYNLYTLLRSNSMNLNLYFKTFTKTHICPTFTPSDSNSSAPTTSGAELSTCCTSYYSDISTDLDQTGIPNSLYSEQDTPALCCFLCCRHRIHTHQKRLYNHDHPVYHGRHQSYHPLIAGV